MMGYPRALAARYEIARTVAAWPSAKPTDTPGRYPRAWCPKLPRDLPACHLAPPNRVTYPRPPSRYPRALAAPLPRALPIPACRALPRAVPYHVPCPTPSRRDALAAPACRSRAGPSCAPNPNQTLGNPTLIEHSFELAEPNRTPVRTNKCSNLHPANLGKVTRITGNRFHSPERFKMLGGSFQSRTLLAGLKVESNTRSIAHLFDGSRG